VDREVRKGILRINVAIPTVPILTLPIEGKKSTFYGAASTYDSGYALMQKTHYAIVYLALKCGCKL